MPLKGLRLGVACRGLAKVRSLPIGFHPHSQRVRLPRFEKRRTLECGGLTPLWIECPTRSENTSDPGTPPPFRIQSASKPAHSKDLRSEMDIRSGDILVRAGFFENIEITFAGDKGQECPYSFFDRLVCFWKITKSFSDSTTAAEISPDFPGRFGRG